jgi:hypothetical protein
VYKVLALIALCLFGCASTTNKLPETPPSNTLITIPSTGGVIGSVNPIVSVTKAPTNQPSTQPTSQPVFTQTNDVPSSGGVIGSINPVVQVKADGEKTDNSVKNFFGKFSGDGVTMAIVFGGAILLTVAGLVLVWKIYQGSQTKELLAIVRELTTLIEKIITNKQS